MLTGRESLIRLIGKRRFLPNRDRFLSNASQKDRNSETEKAINTRAQLKREIIDEADEKKRTSFEETSDSDSVTCPVCGNKVSSDKYSINFHLDTCLTRGAKRKLTQLTLLQFNFSRDTTCSEDAVCEMTDMLQRSPNYVQNITPQLSSLGAIEETEIKACRSLSTYGSNDCKLIRPDNSNIFGAPSIIESIMQDCTDDLSEKHIMHDKLNDMVDASLPSPMCEMSKVNTDKLMDEVSKAVLETHIVGRRFSDEAEIKSGTIVSFRRDPHNDKDPNAIKVVAADSDCCTLLGFLPRDLAKDLSPLIDKHQLIFEGIVNSVPKHPLDVVPIKMACRQISRSKIENVDLHRFKSLWENVLHSIDLGKKYPPCIAKYQQNFRLMVEEALRSNTHLFTDDEKVFLESFKSLSDDGQMLFVRLYTRKGPWFRTSRILYLEILDSQQAVRELLEAGYVSVFDCESETDDGNFKEVLNVLTVTELREILCILKKKCNNGSRKQDFVASILSSYKDELWQLIRSLVFDRTGICIRISSIAESLFWRVQRLFFLNGEQDLSAFLLVDMGITKYPKYKCLISDHVFSDRNGLLAYEEAIAVAQIMDQSIDENNSEVVLKCIDISKSRLSNSPTKTAQLLISKTVPAFLQCFSASWVYSKVVLLSVSFLERERRYNDAIELLKQLLINFTCDGRRGYWTLRLSIDLEHIGSLDESLTAAEDGLLDPWVRAGSRIALQRRVIRLGKPPRRWKTPSYSHLVRRKIPEVPIQGRPLSYKTGMKSRFYGEDGEQCGVEQLALQYYAGEGGGWQGVHTETGIWLTIFGLLMWDIIYADVPNVFRNRFQSAPLDLETDSFYNSRKNLIESHLQNISDGMGETFLIISWESHFGTACRGVNWEKHSLHELRAAIACIGGPCLASICRLLAQDYRSWSRGMPDLLLWRFHGDYKGEAKLVEVKGLRDRLSEQQRAWLLVLMDCGFSAEVCKVSPPPPG
ncbi:hypothetical protein Nepgr_010811 [Nepenthes gracilis]|uniref:Fanconi-associated nuclease n=1 Tax=Nepenthes gracilis TaxID=150966 RepID=A0AAD3XLS2_NEPGR|nr:hypothetical protein Nepgr_010811 [Nepenthes gracilis]